MTITMIVPDWKANAELAGLAEKQRSLTDYVGSLCGYDLHFSTELGCDVVRINSRIETLPDALRDLPIRAVHLVKYNSPVTAAVDGPYHDGGITARVETYLKDSVTQQSLRVTGNNGTTVEELNRWYDDLLVGKKADKNTHPIAYPTEGTVPA